MERRLHGSSYVFIPYVHLKAIVDKSNVKVIHKGMVVLNYNTLANSKHKRVQYSVNRLDEKLSFLNVRQSLIPILSLE